MAKNRAQLFLISVFITTFCMHAQSADQDKLNTLTLLYESQFECTKFALQNVCLDKITEKLCLRFIFSGPLPEHFRPLPAKCSLNDNSGEQKCWPDNDTVRAAGPYRFYFELTREDLKKIEDEIVKEECSPRTEKFKVFSAAEAQAKGAGLAPGTAAGQGAAVGLAAIGDVISAPFRGAYRLAANGPTEEDQFYSNRCKVGTNEVFDGLIYYSENPTRATGPNNMIDVTDQIKDFLGNAPIILNKYLEMNK